MSKEQVNYKSIFHVYSPSSQSLWVLQLDLRLISLVVSYYKSHVKPKNFYINKTTL